MSTHPASLPEPYPGTRYSLRHASQLQPISLALLDYLAHHGPHPFATLADAFDITHNLPKDHLREAFRRRLYYLVQSGYLINTSRGVHLFFAINPAPVQSLPVRTRPQRPPSPKNRTAQLALRVIACADSYLPRHQQAPLPAPLPAPGYDAMHAPLYVPAPGPALRSGALAFKTCRSHGAPC